MLSGHSLMTAVLLYLNATSAQEDLLTYTRVRQVWIARVIEHGQHRVHAQPCRRVRVRLMACSMCVGIDAGCQRLQLLLRARLVRVSLLNGLLESRAPCMQRAVSTLCRLAPNTRH